MPTLLLRHLPAFALLLLGSAVHAQLFRAYLSPTGSDDNACTLAAPCRLLPRALEAVAGGGEIWMLNSANYNTSTVEVSKSLSIIAVPGVVGSVVAIAGPALRVTQGGHFIALRNLVVTPLAGGGGTSGVEVLAGSQVQIYDSLIANLPGSGLVASDGGSVRIVGSIIRSNGQWGVLLTDNSFVSVSTSQLLGNGLGGMKAVSSGSTSTGTRGMISDSVITGGDEGVVVENSSTGVGGLSRITLTRSTIDRTNTAMVARATATSTATVVMSRSMIVNNGTAWNIDGGNAFLFTLQNNHVTHNGPGIGAPTPANPL